MDHDERCPEAKPWIQPKVKLQIQPKVTPDDPPRVVGTDHVGESALSNHMQGIAAEFERLGEVIRRLEARTAQLILNMSDVTNIVSDVVGDLEYPEVLDMQPARHGNLAATTTVAKLSPVPALDTHRSEQRPTKQLLSERVQEAVRDRDETIVSGSPGPWSNSGDPPVHSSDVKPGFVQEVESEDEGITSFPPEMLQNSSVSGLSQKGRLAHRLHRFVEVVPPIVIVLNTTLGLSADICTDCDIWQIAEVFFTLFYLTEFAIKLTLYGCHGYFKGKSWYWNVFDFSCLFLSITELCLAK